MKTIRAGRGLGDSIYLQSVVRHLAGSGERFVVRSDYPAVFSQCQGVERVEPFARDGINILAHYSARKGLDGTNQFDDMCITAGIRDPVDLRLDWKPIDERLIRRLREHNKPIVCVQLPRSPMGRVDGFGKELLPNCKVIQQAIDHIRERALIVQVGAGQPLHKFTGIDVDLANRTNVSQLIDVASIADAFIGYVSFIVPLAESFNKPSLLVWSRAGLRCGQPFISRITPKKVLHKPTSRFVIDDAPEQEIADAANSLL